MKRSFLSRCSRCAIAVLLILTAAFLSSCLPVYYSEELYRETDELCRNAAQTWFTENLPEAQLLDCSVFDAQGELYRVGFGTYELDGETCEFFLNPDTGTLYSDAGMKTVKSEVCRLIAEKLSVSPEQVTLEQLKMGYTFPCKTLTDQTSSGKPKERVEEDAFFYFEGMELSLTGEELTEIAVGALNGNAQTISPILSVSTEAEAETLFPAMTAVMKEHSLVHSFCLQIADEDPEEQGRCSVTVTDGEYRLVRSRIGEDGQTETEVLLTEEKNPYLP